ncbi:MAG: Gldg family protein [Huintestinicola sp.]
MSKKETGEKKPRNLKKFKYGSMSFVIIVLVVAIVVAINIITGLLMKRYPIKLDLTSDKRYELCDETIEALKNLDTDVDIAVIYPKEAFESLANYYGVPYDMIPEILEKYQIYAKDGNGSINVEYIDSTKDPDKVNKYSKYYNGELSDGYVVVYANEQVKVTHIAQMFTSGSQSYYQQSNGIQFVGESAITSAILAVTDANPVKAAFMIYADSTQQNLAFSMQATYSAEQSFEQFLSKNGYEIGYTDIQTNEISCDDYDIVVLPGIEYDISEDTVDALETFLYNDSKYGKSVVYLGGYIASDMPNLTAFLDKWGIGVDASFINDETNCMTVTLASMGSSGLVPTVNVSDSEKVGTLPNTTLPIVAPITRAVNVLDKNTEYVVTELLKSNGTSYLINPEDSENAGENGEYSAAVLSTRELQSGVDILQSNVLAIGSIFMADNTILNNTSSYNNANVLLNIVNGIAGKDDAVIIPQKNLETSTLALTSGQLKGLKILVEWIIPLVVVAAGVVILVRRKNR